MNTDGTIFLYNFTSNKLGMKKMLFAFSLLSILAACSKSNNELRLSGCNLSETHYEANIKPLVAGYCAYAGCHNTVTTTGNNFNFSDYDGLKEAVGSIYDRINRPLSDPLHMPQGFEMDSCSLYKMNIWIINGAPEN